MNLMKRKKVDLRYDMKWYQKLENITYIELKMSHHSKRVLARHIESLLGTFYIRTGSSQAAFFMKAVLHVAQSCCIKNPSMLRR